MKLITKTDLGYFLVEDYAPNEKNIIDHIKLKAS